MARQCRAAGVWALPKRSERGSMADTFHIAEIGPAEADAGAVHGYSERAEVASTEFLFEIS
jgi:hypothetical protein